MLLRVKHEELGNFRKGLSNDADELDDIIESILNDLSRLQNIWQGDDSVVFYKNAFNYYNTMKKIPFTLRVFSEFIRRTDIQYKENDESFARALQQEVGKR